MRALVMSCVLASCVLVATRALAYPLMAPRPIPDAIAGPTDPSVAATFYNPAAIGYLRGIHFFADGGLRLGVGNIERDGNPSAAAGSQALDSFVGVTWDLATDTITIGLAVYTPFSDFSSYARSGPLRYAEQAQTFSTLEETLAGAWQIERHISIGAGFIVNESWLDYQYARDLAPAGGSPSVAMLGYENAQAQQNVRLRGFDYGFGFIVGLIARPDDHVWLGVSYTNHKAGGDLALADAQNAEVSPAPLQGALCGGGSCAGRDRILMPLPEMVNAGLRVTVFPTFEIEAAWRFIHYGARTALDVSLQSGELANAGVPPQFLIDRGLQNTYLVEVSTRHLVRPTLRLSPSLTFETSAIAPDAVNAAAIDAPKLDLALTLEWAAWHKGSTTLTIGAHLGGTAYFLDHVSSRYDAHAATACVDAAYSLAACGKLNAGDALPSESGDYYWFVINGGISLGIHYQP
ncbi:MAG TPA: outer membrane protein transport protein [Polyangia bacterium]